MAAGALALALLLSPNARAERSIFDSLFGSPQPSTPAPVVVDYSRAPAPKKAETPPTSIVMVFGDSMADWLAYGLETALSDTPELGIVRKHRTTAGLIRYDPRNENLDWAQAVREMLAADKPNFVVMLVGMYDRQAIRERVTTPARATTQPNAPAAANPPAGTQPSAPNPEDPEAQDQKKPPAIVAPEPPSRARPAPAAPTTVSVHEFRSDRWVELYTKRVDETIAALKSRGVPVYWVGLPSLRVPKASTDSQFLNDLYRARAEKAGIVYIDVWDGFVDEAGRFTFQGPDFEGQIRRLRANDGVHFTQPGARKLAHYIEREIRRSLTRGPVPVALPSTEPQPQSQQQAARPGAPIERPVAGPVMPLTAARTNAAEELLGAASARIAGGHVTATRVLVNGEAVVPPAGRGDDFAWPRRSVADFGTDAVVTTTTLPLPVMQAAPAQTTVLAPTTDTPATAAVVRRPAPPKPAPQRSFSPFPLFDIFR